MTIIAISRASRYSPNHIGNDAAIFNAVVDELRRTGHTVLPCNEEELLHMSLPEASLTVVTMARDGRTISRLLEWESAGATVINSPQGVLNCVRRPMTELLLQHGIPHPKSWILTTAEPLPADLTFPCWLKRGDSHAIVKEDVCYAATPDEALRSLADMHRRGIPTAVANEHLPGDLVKFYGVQGDSFFHWFYPSAASHSKFGQEAINGQPQGHPFSSSLLKQCADTAAHALSVPIHSKFGLEAINGQPQGHPFSPSLLKQCADTAARALSVPIYGGDAVVSPDGSLRIIDFNDFPSFAPCRPEAAKAIARRVTK